MNTSFKTATALSALIVDDEFSARETLSNYIRRYCKGIEIIGEAADVTSAVQAIRQLKPGLVFLDVEMPFGNAFDVLEQTSDINYETIFITAFSEYAVKAFQFSAAHYLLKPVDIGDLVAAVEKVKMSVDRNLQPEWTKVLNENLQNPGNRKLVLPTTSGFEVIPVARIIRLGGSSNYTEIFLDDGRKKVVSKVLKHFEDLLSGNGFMRVHKSHIINLDHVKSYHRGKGGWLEMDDGSEIEVSPSKKQELLDHF